MTMQLPTNLPAAQLPALYASAKTAIVKCEALDECKDWADKAAALASYAKQANDDELENVARRIRARAIRRCGELLKAIPSAQGTRTDLFSVPGVSSGRWQTGRDSGLSNRQMETALNIIGVSDTEFEQVVEREKAPTIAELQELASQTLPPLGVGSPEPPKVCPTCGQTVRQRL